LLAVADEATVLALAPGAAARRSGVVEPPAPDALVGHLTKHGVTANGDRLVFDPSSIEPAERLLSYLADTGADLLVMGAAGQQLGRSAAKRSLTRQVLIKMTVPVLLSY
jgi:nucleotide-binding universal stress UspA family protein